MISQVSYRYFPALLACFMALAFFLPCHAFAQTLDIDKIVNIASSEFLSDEAFAAQTDLLEETPFGDDDLAFSVRLPKEWKPNIKMPIDMLGEKEGASLLGIVARYVSPAKDYLRSTFYLETIQLDYNIPIKYWFTSYVLARGYSLEAVTIHSNKKIEAIYVEVDGDNSYAVRLLALNNGGRMVLVRYRTPMAQYEAEKQMQAQVLSSFSLLKSQAGGAEEIKTHAFLSESYFDYPGTWKLIPTKVHSISRMQASLAQGKNLKRLDGQISIFLASQYEKTSLKNEVRLFKDKLNIKNYKLGGYIEKQDLIYDESMVFGVTEVYEMTPTVPTQVEYELWVSVMQNDDYYYLVSLLTPSRKNELYKWARNVEAYKTVVGSMRRYNSDDKFYIQ